MTEKKPGIEAVQNTDREIYRGPSRAEFGDPDRFYADSIFVTKTEGIGIQCGGTAIVMPIREWFLLATTLKDQHAKELEEAFDYGVNMGVSYMEACDRYPMTHQPTYPTYADYQHYKKNGGGE